MYVIFVVFYKKVKVSPVLENFLPYGTSGLMKLTIRVEDIPYYVHRFVPSLVLCSDIRRMCQHRFTFT